MNEDVIVIFTILFCFPLGFVLQIYSSTYFYYKFIQLCFTLAYRL